MIVRTRPSLSAFDTRVDRMFDQLTHSLRTSGSRPPVVDASWIDGALQLTVDLPGTPEDAVHVDVAGRTLTIGVDTEQLQWDRSVRLGNALDPEQVSARYVHGRLTVTVAAAASPEKRQIAIDTKAPEAPAIEASESTDSAETSESTEA
jgi:HSP20 family molecular chaperone IbpA